MCPVKVSLNDVIRLNEIISGEIKLASFDEEDLKACEIDVTADGTDLKLSQCGVCKFHYKTRDEQVKHYKSKYHNYNLSLHMMKKSPLTLNEFQAIQKTNENGGNIALSDSINLDSSESEEQLTNTDKQFSKRLPKFYFSNNIGECFCFYKKLLYYEKNNQTQNEIISISRDLLTSAYCQFWTVILFNGDHFAAAVFEGDCPVVHKTLHHYVVRAKRGTSQSANDNAKGGKQNKAKSAGANLRRYNEGKQAADIYELLSTWKENYLDKCKLIFVKIPPTKKEIFTGGKKPIFQKKDPRIRQIPFATKKPLFNEVVRTHTELYSITLYDKEAALNLFKHSENRERKLNKKLTPYQKSMSPDKNVCKRKEKKKQAVYSDLSTNDVLPKRLENAHVELTKEVDSMKKSIEYPTNENLRKVRKKCKKVLKENENSKKNEESFLNDDKMKDQQSLESNSLQRNFTLFENILPVEEDFLVLLYTSCNTNKLGQFNDLISQKKDPNNHLSVNLTCNIAEKRIPLLLSTVINTQGDTLLHVVAKSGKNDIIRSLLEHGSDPCKRNSSSSLPYNLCSSKSSRNVFRKFRGEFPEKYNYKLAEIPPPLSPEAEKNKLKKKREKKAARKKRAIDHKKNEQVEEIKSESGCTMSGQEKKLCAIESRMKKDIVQVSTSVVSEECDECGVSLFAKTPYKYSIFKLCSTKCVKAHRISNR